MIPHKIEELDMISLPFIRIEGRALQRQAFSLERFGDELSAHKLTARVQG